MERVHRRIPVGGIGIDRAEQDPLQVGIDRVIGGIEQQLEANPRMREQISGWLRLEAR